MDKNEKKNKQTEQKGTSKRAREFSIAILATCALCLYLYVWP